MALKAIIDELESIEDEAVRKEYRRGDDGRYYLDLEGTPRGFTKTADVAETNSKLETFRENNRNLHRELEESKDKLKSFDGIDPEEHKRLKEQADGIKKKGVNAPEDIEAMVTRAVEKATTPLNERIKGLETERDDAKSSLGRSEVRTALTAAATAAGVDTEHALDDFLERGSKVFKYEDGKVIAKAEDGAPLFNPDDGNTPLSAKAWAAGLASKAPHLFKKNSGGGAGGGGGAPPTVRKVSSDPLEFGKNAEDIAKGKASTVGADS